MATRLSMLYTVQDLISTCYDNRNENKFSALVMLDLKKAFDTVNHSILLKKLNHYGIRGEANYLIQSYLSDRKQYVLLDDKASSHQPVTLGVPQGSILGPLLFIIYINDLSTCTSRTNVSLFADDTCLCVSDTNLTKLQQTVNDEIELVQRWMNANMLTINPTKSVALLINPKTNWKNLIEISINKSYISSQDTSRYLGIELDNNLKFHKHISNLTSKLSRLTGVFAKIKKISQ